MDNAFKFCYQIEKYLTLLYNRSGSFWWRNLRKDFLKKLVLRRELLQQHSYSDFPFKSLYFPPLVGWDLDFRVPCLVFWRVPFYGATILKIIIAIFSAPALSEKSNCAQVLFQLHFSSFCAICCSLSLLAWMRKNSATAMPQSECAFVFKIPDKQISPLLFDLALLKSSGHRQNAVWFFIKTSHECPSHFLIETFFPSETSWVGLPCQHFCQHPGLPRSY